MEYLVKLIEVLNTSDENARNSLQSNCTHVAGDYWLFEGDCEGLDKGVKFEIVGEEAIEGYGDLDESQIIAMVVEKYNIDPCVF